MDIDIRDATTGDIAHALRINEAVVPAVNSLSEERMQWFLEQAPWFRVAAHGDDIVGILVGFYEGSDYASENYRWFSRQYARFAYVDRVAVRRKARRLRIATRLYEDFIENIPAEVPVLTCEVNTRPPNPDSIVFHERLGFEQVGSQQTEEGRKQVALLARRLHLIS